MMIGIDVLNFGNHSKRLSAPTAIASGPVKFSEYPFGFPGPQT